MKDVVEDLTGKQLGPYQLVSVVGKGGMGVVYQAYEARLTRYVALKVLARRYADDPDFVSRFWQEARAAANLEHPHILPIYSYGEYERYHYIAMQLARDGSLAELLLGVPLLPKQMVHIVTQIGSALDYAHSQNVIHRDVKPDNILISRLSGCLLTDFGIAKLLEATTRHTEEGSSFGTPAYMSPEQARGDEQVDGRSDVYSLGIVLYEMATGRVPFQGTVQAIQMGHLYSPPPPPQELNPALPDAVVEVILRALAKKPDERFATAGDMAQALQIAVPEGMVPSGAGAAAAILGPVPTEALDTGEPLGSEELTAILEASSAAPSPEERRRAPTQPIPGVARTAGQRLRQIPAVVWVAALVLLGVILAGAVIGLGGTGKRLLGAAGTPTGAAGTPTPLAVAGAEETQTPTASATPTSAFITPVPPSATRATSEPAPTASATAVPQPTATETRRPTRPASATPSATAEPTATNTPAAARPAAPDLSGQLAVPLMYGNEPKVYIVDTSGELVDIVGGARQPDYDAAGARLIVNGAFGGWDKLRVSGPIGEEAFEIGDPALAGHSYPSWSPDASRVIYEDATVDPRGPRIFIRGLNTNGPGSGPGTMLTVGIGQGELIGRQPVWASQDRFIFRGCNTWEPGMESECGLWLMQGNAGEPERLTNNPSQIPNDVRGDTLVYASAEAGDWNVYTLDLSTGATRRLTEDGAADGLATISPDGRSVAFVSNRGGSLGVWTVPIGGGTARKLFDLPAEWGGLREDGWAEEKLAWGPE